MLKDDWFDVIERDREFPDGHFEALLWENDNWRNPMPLFKILHGGLRYCERLSAMTEACLLRGQYFIADPDKRISEAAMLPLLEGYRDVLMDVAQIEDMHEEVKFLKSAVVRFEPDYADFDALFRGRAKTPWSDIPSAMDDFCIDKLFEKDRNLRLVGAATLQLTMSKEITMWVMEPLVRTGLNLQPGYDIAIGGGLVAVLQDEIVCHIQDF